MRLAADSSILVRLYLDKEGADAIEQFLADDAKVLSVSALARIEVLNVLLRDPDLGAAARFEEDLDEGIRLRLAAHGPVSLCRSCLARRPQAGVGTIPFEAALRGRRVLGADISPYARILSKAKLSPPPSLEVALSLAERALEEAAQLPRPDLRVVPAWVRRFYHPDTLREVLNFAYWKGNRASASRSRKQTGYKAKSWFESWT